MHKFITDHDETVEFKNGQMLHGDVILDKIKSLPKDFESLDKTKEPVLAYGEVTGHSHKLFRIGDHDGAIEAKVDMRVDKDGTIYFKLLEPAVLRHQEHHGRILPAGLYRSKVQREYDPFSKKIRQVAD